MTLCIEIALNTQYSLTRKIHEDSLFILLHLCCAHPDNQCLTVVSNNFSSTIRHPNVIKLLGICAQEEAIHILMELVVGLNLDMIFAKMRKARPVETQVSKQKVTSTNISN